MPYIFRLISTIVLLIAFALPLTTIRSLSAENSVHYIALGDSISAGIGSSLPRTRGYPSIVNQLLGKQTASQPELTNLSIPGETAASFLADGQLSEFIQLTSDIDILDGEIALVTVSLGGNEILSLASSSIEERERALAAFDQNIRQATESIRNAAGNEVSIVLTNYYDLTSEDPDQDGTNGWWINQFNLAIENAANLYQASVANVHQLFRGNIDSYTHAPVDVHPNNRGYMAIARAVWGSLGSDTEAPVILVTSGTATLRATPTLKIQVTDNTKVAEAGASVNGVEFQLLNVGEQEYVLLLDFNKLNIGVAEVEIVASDDAGNTARTFHVMRFTAIELVVS